MNNSTIFRKPAILAFATTFSGSLLLLCCLAGWFSQYNLWESLLIPILYGISLFYAVKRRSSRLIYILCSFSLILFICQGFICTGMPQGKFPNLQTILSTGFGLIFPLFPVNAAVSGLLIFLLSRSYRVDRIDDYYCLSIILGGALGVVIVGYYIGILICYSNNSYFGC